MPQGGNQFLGAFNQNQIQQKKKNTDQQIYNNNKSGILHTRKTYAAVAYASQIPCNG